MLMRGHMWTLPPLDPLLPHNEQLGSQGNGGCWKGCWEEVWVPSALWYPQEDHGAVLATNHCPTLP